MVESVSSNPTEKYAERSEDLSGARQDKKAWETPLMEDVSEQVMAQPYIRFT